MERFENAIMSLSCIRIVFNESANFENDATTTENYSSSDTQTMDFLLVSTVFNRFHRFSKTAENDTKTIRKGCVDAIQSFRFHSKQYRFR